MESNQSNIKRKRTLLILLGIILACVLILNAQSVYSADILNQQINEEGLSFFGLNPFSNHIKSIGLYELAEKIAFLNLK